MKQVMPHVAVIGTGRMGSAMAGRLLDSGMEVSVWSRNPASMMALVDQGAIAFAEASDSVQDADVVITTLPTAPATASVMVDGAALDSMRQGAIWVQMAAIGIDATEWLGAETLRRRPDVTFVDAPIAGSREQAVAGCLLIPAAGPADPDVQLSLRPVFDALGRETLWLGPVGAGSRMELILNVWLASHTEGAASQLPGRTDLDRPATRAREVETVGVGSR